MDLESSEAEVPRGSQPCSSKPKTEEAGAKPASLSTGMKQLQMIMGEGEEDSASEGEDSEDDDPVESRFKAPGGRGKKGRAEKSTRRSKEKSQRETLMEMMLANQAAGQGWLRPHATPFVADDCKRRRIQRKVDVAAGAAALVVQAPTLRLEVHQPRA